LFFAVLLRPRRRQAPVSGLFPEAAHLAVDTPDVIQHGVFRPLIDAALRFFARARWIQHGHLHLYVLYIALAVLVVVVWSLWKP
jgi:hydrogenase-4 component B